MQSQFNSGWYTACSGFGCQSYLSALKEQWNQDLVNELIKEIDDMEDELGVEIDNDDKKCGNGYTPKEISEAYIKQMANIGKEKANYDTVISSEAVFFGSFGSIVYGPVLASSLSSGYKLLAAGLLGFLESRASENLQVEYKAAMATCP